MSVYVCVVIDTNVILSAALSPTGAPAALLDRLLPMARLVFTDDTFAELETRLWKPKFDLYISIERRHELLHDFSAIAHWVSVPESIAQLKYSRDPSDDKFVHAALASGATRLVTGDDDLLCLTSVGDVALRIVSPRRALQEWIATQGIS